MNEFLEDIIRLRASDYDMYDRLMPHCILDLFQDAAGKHATVLGCSYEWLLEHNMYWILVRTKFEIVKYPPLYATVKSVTWPHEKGLADFDREYEIRDMEGNLLVKGLSKWVVVNAQTRRLVPGRNVTYNGDIWNHTNFEKPFPKLPEMSLDGLKPFTTTMHFCDLDHNGHVNNINYTKYILNALNLTKDEVIRTFEIDYVKELRTGETLDIYYTREDKTINVQGMNGNGTLCIMAKITLY